MARYVCRCGSILSDSVTPEISYRVYSDHEWLDIVNDKTVTGPSGKRVEVCADAADAVRRAMAEAGPEDVICCVGSLYMTGAVRTACRELLG